MEKRIDKLKRVISEFPQTPGVYIMRDGNRHVIYVGKAKKLKNRVYSYFSGKKSGKTAFLISKVDSIETIHCTSEYEALILENNLIKRWKPKYNIRLKDGKSYPVIRITNEKFPRVFKTRTIINDKSRYYGPFADGSAAEEYIALIRAMFPVRRCKSMKGRKEPCLYYHMEKCSAPCVGKVSKEDYNSSITRIKNLLAGRTVQILDELQKEMRKASAELKFEYAAKLRDRIRAIKNLNESGNMEDFDSRSRDYAVLVSSGELFSFTVMQFREGKATGREIFVSEYAGNSDEAVQDFIVQYYSREHISKPARLILETGNMEIIEAFFENELERKIIIERPEGKRDRAIIAMARENALRELERKMKKRGDMSALNELREALNLKSPPQRIEGFDIAQLGGRYTVASLVSFKNGIPDKKKYRHYRIRSLEPGQVDDFKAIAEAVSRRYTRVLNDNLERPDLILIDGGKGQVSSAWSVLKALGLDSEIALCGIAKREELIYLPEEPEPIDLPEGDLALRILQNVRDETHRFATNYNQKLRKRDIKLTSLEAVPGIGKRRSEKLLTKYKSLDGISNSKAEDIAKTAGISEEVAETLILYLRKS